MPANWQQTQDCQGSTQAPDAAHEEAESQTSAISRHIASTLVIYMG